MSAKVRKIGGYWTVVTHWQGRRTKRRIGSSATAKAEAEKAAREINARLALGTAPHGQDRGALPFDAQARAWHAAYSTTFKPSYEESSRILLERHLIPHFGSMDLREIRETDLLDFIRRKLDEGKAPATAHNALSIVRRILNLARREGLIDRNPAERIGELMSRVDRRTAKGVSRADAWSSAEVETLLALAHEHEPRFYAPLHFLLGTGVRRGELLGLRWEDVDFDQRRVTINRAIVRGAVTTPKSGRGRVISIPLGLASVLLDLLAQCRREVLARGWKDVPPWVFCSETGRAIEERNFERSWQRLRRRATKHGVRPLRLHCTRHTYASRAISAGKSIRWVASQLGHANVELTLRTYTHLLREEESNLDFAEFGPGRPYTAPGSESDSENENAAEANYPTALRNLLERETGFEPATLGLGMSAEHEIVEDFRVRMGLNRA